MIDLKPVVVEGKLLEVVLEAKVRKSSIKISSRFLGNIFPLQVTQTRFEKFSKDPSYLNGMGNYSLYMQEHIDITQSKMAR